MSYPAFIPTTVRAEFLAAVTAAGTRRILARASWLRETCDFSVLEEPFRIMPGRMAIKLECPNCIEVWAVHDWDIDSDWVVR